MKTIQYLTLAEWRRNDIATNLAEGPIIRFGPHDPTMKRRVRSSSMMIGSILLTKRLLFSSRHEQLATRSSQGPFARRDSVLSAVRIPNL